MRRGLARTLQPRVVGATRVAVATPGGCGRGAHANGGPGRPPRPGPARWRGSLPLAAAGFTTCGASSTVLFCSVHVEAHRAAEGYDCLP